MWEENSHDSLNYLISHTHVPLSHHWPPHSLGDARYRRERGEIRGWEQRKKKCTERETGNWNRENKDMRYDARLDRDTPVYYTQQGWMFASLATDKLSQIVSNKCPAEINVHPQMHTETQTQRSLCKLFFFAIVNVYENITVCSCVLEGEWNGVSEVKVFTTGPVIFPLLILNQCQRAVVFVSMMCWDKNVGFLNQIKIKIIGHCNQYDVATYCTYMQARTIPINTFHPAFFKTFFSSFHNIESWLIEFNFIDNTLQKILFFCQSGNWSLQSIINE